MATKQEWEQQANEYEHLSRETQDDDLHEYFSNKASACRECASYALDEEYTNNQATSQKV